jgi:hypothetical protein
MGYQQVVQVKRHGSTEEHGAYCPPCCARGGAGSRRTFNVNWWRVNCHRCQSYLSGLRDDLGWAFKTVVPNRHQDVVLAAPVVEVHVRLCEGFTGDGTMEGEAIVVGARVELGDADPTSIEQRTGRGEGRTTWLANGRCRARNDCIRDT